MRLRNEGRELLGKEIVVTEKRDGENVSVWLDENNNIRVSSHNQIDAAQDITDRMKKTPEWAKITEALKYERENFKKDYIVFGELLKLTSPTRIERRRKHVHWVIFDIRDLSENRYLDYNFVYQRAYQWRIPVVRAMGVEVAKELEELAAIKEKWLKWCKRHSREGFVGKCYHEQIFFKEKIDLPKLKRIPHPDLHGIILPPMPEERILRALQHAFDELGQDEEKWKDKIIAMPVIARHISTEAAEHDFAPPHNFYGYYINTPIEKIKAKEGDLNEKQKTE